MHPSFSSVLRILVVVGFVASSLLPVSHPVQAQQFDSLIKGKDPTVYFFSNNGKRYSFPNLSVYQSWYPTGATITQITDQQLSNMPLGGNITYKPGMALVKITTNPKVYAVSKGGVLRWIASEELARALYGSDWNKKVFDVADVLFVNYTIGTPITQAKDYDKNLEAGSVITPGDSVPGMPSSIPVGVIPIVSPEPKTGYAEVDISLSASQATLNQTVSISSRVSMYTSLIHKIEIFRETSNQPIATCLNTTECGTQYFVQQSPLKEKFYAVATNAEGERFESPLHVILTVAAVSNNLQTTISPQILSVGSRASFSGIITNNQVVESHKIFAHIPGGAEPILWKDCKTEKTCASSTPFYRTTSLYSQVVSEGQTYISPETLVQVIGGEAPKPGLRIIDRPAKNQVTFQITAPYGEDIFITSLSERISDEDSVIALCDSVCTVTVQIQVPTEITAYTSVGGKIERSDTFEVKPE
ncbi:hypothetical protein IT408_03450 [Candidatus Uhrbacteria bacterium]|nr:hypothetical protein [Candidatus Uhrbacteria bacterium]